MNYKSQWEQDKILNQNIFKNKRNGFFVDVGAHDGVTINNTYFFEKELGWKGLCIEPLDKIFDQLKKNRNAICIHGCAYKTTGKVPFREITDYCEMLSGIENTYNDRHKHRISSEMSAMGGNSKISEKNAYRLEDLFEQYNIVDIDYLTIDTEGSELEVLQGINFNKVKIHVIDIENNYPDEFAPIHNLLISKGFTHYGKIGGDEVYKYNTILRLH